MDTDPTLYILMRTDLTSLNPGKAMAQAAHAANQFTRDMEAAMHGEEGVSIDMHNMYFAWKHEGTGFGTTIVLGVIDASLYRIRDMIIRNKDSEVMFGIVTDESYPVSDGNTVHHVSCDTCAYIFGDRNSIKEKYVSMFGLHK